jgi:DNA-binding MarR family transcriptional regulator
MGMASGTVVTRMLRALERLGWVTRSRPAHDQRQWWVQLTPDAFARMGAIYRIIVRAVQRWVDVAIGFGRHRDPAHRFRQMATLESFLHALRCELGDRATLAFPWGHPDD